MRYLLKLSGEHPTLPLAELEGVLEGEGLRWGIEEDYGGGLALAEVASSDPAFLQRLALTKKACEYAGEGADLKELARKVHERICECRSFVVRAKSENLEREFGRMLHDKGLSVSLKNPEVEVDLFKAGDRIIAGLDIPLKRDFNARKPQYRPFFSPTSMHPKLARVMVNLARVKKGDTVLDPFCGTGGILIEAGLMGMKPVGYDISEKMTSGCTQNLAHYGLKGRITQKDALKDNGQTKADAIATDPPYGRASYTSEKKVDKLYSDFLAQAGKIVKKDGYAIIMLPHNKKIQPNGFETKAKYDTRVHKSLTRRIWVLKKTIL